MAASALDSTGVDSPNAFRRSTVTEEAFVLHIKEAGIVRTRRKRLRKFRRCFSGADLVEWLATDSACCGRPIATVLLDSLPILLFCVVSPDWVCRQGTHAVF